MNEILLNNPPARVSMHLGEPFTITETSDGDPPQWQRIHPQVHRMPRGRLVLTVNRDRDIPDAALLVFTSDDQGQSWQETTHWPTAKRRGEHVSVHPMNLHGDHVLALRANGLFPTDQPGRFVLPTWHSHDGGTTWGDMTAAYVTLNTSGGTPLNIYDPPQWYLDLFDGRPNVKPQMPSAIRRMAETFGYERLGFNITDSHVFDDGRALVFAYVVKLAPGTRGKHETVVLESTDAGQSWRHIATPGAWENRFDGEFFLTHRTDGLCEPAVTRAGDELVCVMRLGSRHPLYQSRSGDGGRSWSKPQGMPVYGILPSLVTLEDGTVLLATGRPDVTLSVSVDGGHRWPLTYRFLEDGKPLDASTRNNAMIAVGPQRVLYLHDHGGYHTLPAGFEGKRRVVGQFVDVAVTATC